MKNKCSVRATLKGVRQPHESAGVLTLYHEHYGTADEENAAGKTEVCSRDEMVRGALYVCKHCSCVYFEEEA